MGAPLEIRMTDDGVVAFRGGREAGRVEMLVETPLVAYLACPDVAAGEDVLEVARALLEAGAARCREAGCVRVEVILEDRVRHCDVLVDAMRGWGHRPLFAKRLFARSAEKLPDLGDGGLAFAGISGPDDARLLAVLEEVFRDGVTAEREGQTAAELIEELANICRHEDPEGPRHWEIALEGRRAVGAVMPGLVLPEVGTNLFVCLVPAVRGLGHGTSLHLRGLRIARRRGAKCFLGSCHVGNEPMARVFLRLGYEQTALQRYFAWRA